MDQRTKVENNCQTTKIEPGPTTFCIQTQKTVFEFYYQTYSQVLILFVLVSLPKIRLTLSSLSLFTFYREVFLSHGLLLQQMDTTSLPYLMVNRINQLLIMEDQSWTIVRLCFGKTPNQCLELRIYEERKSFTRVSLVYLI